MATLYVKWDATGAGDGSSWADAYTTIAAAHAAALQDDTLEISGGAAGHTYTENLTLTTAVTLQGSQESGHDGVVTINGQIRPDNSGSSVVYINDITHVVTGDYVYPIYLAASSVSEWNRCTMGKYSAYQRQNRIYGGTHTFKRCHFIGAVDRFNYGQKLFYPVGASTMEFQYCIFDGAGTISDALTAGSTFVMKNCLCLGSNYDFPNASFVNIGNSATTTVTIKNTVFMGVHPVQSGASSVLTVEDVAWHKHIKVGGTTTFDTSNKATIGESDLGHTDPKFTTAKNTTIGQFCLRYDDRNNLATSVADMATLNPEVVFAHFIDLHGHVAQTRPTAQEIDYMRQIIAAGNEIGCHSATHSDSSDLGFIDISATGTNPTLDITGTRTGDSSTWTGTLTVTINGTPKNYDLTTYETIGELITALNGDTVGDGTITASKHNSDHSDHLKSLCLADVTGQSISGGYEAQGDDAAYTRFEVAEAKLDLEAYITSAQDRNGNNSVAGTTEPAPSYTCTSYASPYGRGRASVLTELQGDSDIIGASRADGNVNSGNMHGHGAANNLYQFPYQQMNIPNVDADTFAIAAGCATGPYAQMPLYHGTGPTFGGTLAGFKALLVSFGLATETFSEFVSRLRADDAFTVSEPNINWDDSEADEDYLRQGNYVPAEGSPLINAGQDLGLTEDFAGNSISGNPDIGAYEQPIVVTSPSDLTFGTPILGTPTVRSYSERLSIGADDSYILMEVEKLKDRVYNLENP